MTGLEEFLSIEKQVDRVVQELPLLQMPVRVPLSMVLVVLHGLFHGTPLTGVQPNVDSAQSLAARLSHVAVLLANCPGAPTGKDAEDVMEACQNADPDGSQGKLLISYAHFADLMPEVHRAYYAVTGSIDQGFKLRHASEAFAASEAEDILLCELALNFVVSPHSEPDNLFDDLAMMPPGQLSPSAILTIKRLAAHYLTNLFEISLVDDDGLREAIGVTHEEFRRFRSALWGMAVFSSALAKAYARQLGRDSTNQTAFREWLYWVAPVWGLEFFRGYLITESGLADEKVERLLSLLSLDYRNGKPLSVHASDGYFPPIWQLPGMLLLGDDLVPLFTQIRNLLFSVQRTDPTLFDKVVSKYLEPQLVSAASQIFAAIPDLVIKPNVEWTTAGDNGELDVLVYDTRQNVAVHIQAKAPLPPQGARLIKRLESRLEEGIAQLRRFHLLPEPDRDTIISRAVGRMVTGVRIIDVLLARSCFGTHSVREKAQDITLLSLPILAGAVSNCMSSHHLDLEDVITQSVMLKEEMIMQANPRWEYRLLTVGKFKLEIPIFRFDEAAMTRLRFHVWRDNVSLGLTPNRDTR